MEESFEIIEYCIEILYKNREKKDTYLTDRYKNKENEKISSFNRYKQRLEEYRSFLQDDVDVKIDSLQDKRKRIYEVQDIET